MNIYHRLLLSLLLLNVVQLQAMDMINSMVVFLRTNPGLIKTVVIVATTLVLSETRIAYKMRSQEKRLIMLIPKQKPGNRETTDEENNKKLLLFLPLLGLVDENLTLSLLRKALKDEESAPRGTCDLAINKPLRKALEDESASNKPPAGGATRDDKAQKTTGSPSRQRPE